jgi:hypothetical protein
MILRLYNHIGTSLHGDDVELPASPIPRIGEWLRFHKDEADWRKGVYRVVAIDYAIHHGKLVPWITAHEASEEHYEEAKTAIHDEHSRHLTALRAAEAGLSAQ